MHKRKAEDQDASARPKVPRIEHPPSRSATSSPAQRSLQPPSKQPVPYQGTGKASATPSPGPAVVPNPTGSPAPNAASRPAAPKTGYLAMLERAKAAQEAAKPMGQIKHVRKEKLTRREREKMLAEAAAANKTNGLQAKGGKAAPGSRGNSATPIGTKPGDPAKKERRPVEIGYKGTIRPTSSSGPSYRGTMQSGKANASQLRRHVAHSDEEDGDDDEDEEDYESGSSDMEAGRDDIDREEMQSVRAARMEDEAALREENELKRQKLERQQKLQKLQAAAAAKKKMY